MADTPESAPPPGAPPPPDAQPPPPSAPPPGAVDPRGAVVDLEGPMGGFKRLLGPKGPSRIAISAPEIVIEHSQHLRAPLRLAPGGIAVASIDQGPGKVEKGAVIGRFPVLRRLSATAIVPREEGIEGWLWTSSGGSALTLLGDEEVAPNLALVFLKPLEEAYVTEVFEPSFLDDLAKRSPLGSPTVFGVLLRAVDVKAAQTALDRLQLLRPLTDREVPPTQRRHLPSDKPANPLIAGSADAGRAGTSVPPPGVG